MNKRRIYGPYMAHIAPVAPVAPVAPIHVVSMSSSQTGPDRARQAQPDKSRPVQRGPDTSRQAQTGPDRPRETQRSPETPRDQTPREAQGRPESLKAFPSFHGQMNVRIIKNKTWSYVLHQSHIYTVNYKGKHNNLERNKTR